MPAHWATPQGTLCLPTGPPGLLWSLFTEGKQEVPEVCALSLGRGSHLLAGAHITRLWDLLLTTQSKPSRIRATVPDPAQCVTCQGKGRTAEERRSRPACRRQTAGPSAPSGRPGLGHRCDALAEACDYFPVKFYPVEKRVPSFAKLDSLQLRFLCAFPLGRGKAGGERAGSKQGRSRHQDSPDPLRDSQHLHGNDIISRAMSNSNRWRQTET